MHPSGRPPQGGWKPGPGITLGGSFAYLRGGNLSNAYLQGLEFTWFQKMWSPFSWWVTGGGKFATNGDETVVLPTVELGVNVAVFNIGTGYAFGLPDTMGRHLWNGFVGLSFPVYTPRRGSLLFLQVYYRPIFTFPLDAHGIAHEMGLMLKWLWAFGQI